MACIFAAVYCIAMVVRGADDWKDLNNLTDAISIINDYLPHDDQRAMRLVNRRFNYYYNQAHSNIIESMLNFSVYAQQIVVYGIVRNEYINALETIYQKFRFNQYYIKRWPKILGLALQQKWMPGNKTWMRNLMLFLDTINMRPWSNSTSLKGVVGLLVLVSYKIFRSLIWIQMVRSPKHLDFHSFLYQSIWIYLSVCNSSFKLPPLDCIYYLDVSRDLYPQQISNLHALHNDYGLIIWDPSILQPKWSSESFYQYVNEYKFFSGSYRKFIVTGFDGQFVSFLQARFILKLLKNNQYDFGLIENQQHPLFDFLKDLIHKTVHHLWIDRHWNAMDQILLALHNNHALELLHEDHFLVQLCVASNSTETFIGILVELYDYDDLLEYYVCNRLAKSAYFWFVDKNAEQAMAPVSELCNYSLFEPEVHDVFVAFLEEPMFSLFGNESRR